MGASSILLHCIWVAHGGQGHHAWQRQLGKGTYRLALAIPIIIQLPSLNLRHLIWSQTAGKKIREDLVHLMWSWWGPRDVARRHAQGQLNHERPPRCFRRRRRRRRPFLPDLPVPAANPTYDLSIILSEQEDYENSRKK